MWKFVSRSLRNTLKRHKNTLYNRSLRNRNFAKNVKPKEEKIDNTLTSSIVNFNKQGFGSTKDDKTRGDEFKWDTKHSWQGAVGWTSAIALGWVVCQSLCLRKILNDFWNNSTKQIPIDLHFFDIISELKKIEPKQMLKISYFNNLKNEKEEIPIAFGSINHEEFDMLVHRQQSF